MSWTKHTKEANGVGDYTLKNEDYFSRSEFLEAYGPDVKILGGYINTSAKHGPHPVIFCETPDGVKGLSLTQSYTEQWKAIFNDPDDVATIESGGATGQLVKRVSKTHGEYVAFNLS